MFPYFFFEHFTLLLSSLIRLFGENTLRIISGLDNMNKKIIKIGMVVLLMLVICGSVVNAWPWSNNDDKQNNNIKFDQSKFEQLLQEGQFSVQAGDFTSALKSYKEAAKMKQTGQNLQRLTYNIGMLSEQAGDYDTSLYFTEAIQYIHCSRSQFKDRRFYCSA